MKNLYRGKKKKSQIKQNPNNYSCKVTEARLALEGNPSLTDLSTLIFSQAGKRSVGVRPRNKAHEEYAPNNILQANIL